MRDVFREELRRAIKLREAEDANYDQQQLARASGVSDTHLSAILTGRRNASADVIRKLAGALDKSPNETERWIVLNSLPPESSYALKPDEVAKMLSSSDGGIQGVNDSLRVLIELSSQQLKLLERIIEHKGVPL